MTVEHRARFAVYDSGDRARLAVSDSGTQGEV